MHNSDIYSLHLVSVTAVGSAKGSVQTINNEECKTTQQAEIFFIIDASSSVRDYNYVKMLNFVVSLTQHYALGAEQVGGTIIYNYVKMLDFVGYSSIHIAAFVRLLTSGLQGDIVPYRSQPLSDC